jgi:hypothetical protein
VDPTRQLLLDYLDSAFNKRSWHGPNLRSSLRGVPAGIASKRIAGRKTIWEQTLHAAFWKHRAASWLGAPERLPWPGQNWPRPSGSSQADWRRDLQALEQVHQRLREAVACAKSLDRRATWLVYGAAAHDIYHAGQIRLLRRLLMPGRKTKPS